jgi:regulator of nonsense transcripts 1
VYECNLSPSPSHDDTGYLYHRLLGHEVEAQPLKTTMPKRFSVPGLPELNPSQMDAIKSVLKSQLALIQGRPSFMLCYLL